MNRQSPEAKQGTISVVICAYTEGRWNNLVEAVASVSRQTLPPLEVLVVIDHNPSLLKRACKHLANIVVVSNTGPRGLSGARNSGVALAKGEIVAFIDDDARAEADWLEQLAKAYADSKVMGVGGAIEPQWATEKPAWFPEEFLWVVGCTYRGMPTKMESVRNLIGANMSFRREVFGRVGGFRTELGRIGTLPVGCEETELCIRMKQHMSGTLLYNPGARVAHHVTEQRMTLAYFLSRCYAEGLSKVRVSRLVGAEDGLASERTYATRTLTRGVATGLKDFLLRRDGTGVLRAGYITTGFCVTAFGYLRGLGGQWLLSQETSKPAKEMTPLGPL